MKLRSAIHCRSSIACGIVVLGGGALLASAHTAQAGINVWTTHGPGGAQVSALAIDPITPSTLYAAAFGGVFKSTDGANSWHAANTGLPHGASALAIDPKTPTTLYAVGGTVFKSTNSGESWRNTGLAASKLLIDPNTPTTLYATSYDSGVVKSTDGGESWRAFSSGGLPDNSAVREFVIDPRMPNTLFASVDSNCECGLEKCFCDRGVFKSTDGGDSWSASNFPGLPLFGPLTSATLYARWGNLFKSTDGGVTWNVLDTPNHLVVDTLAIDPKTPTTLYAASDSSDVFKSTDGGESWQAMSTGPPIHPSATSPAVLALAIDPKTPATLYAWSPYHGAFKSRDGGDSWQTANTGLPIVGVETYALAVDPIAPSTLYATSFWGVVYKSTDAAATWSEANSGFDGYFGRVLAVDPLTPSTLYAPADSGHIFKSTDAAATWSRVGLPTTSGVSALAIDPLTPSTLYAGTFGDGIFKSTDAAATWGKANVGPTPIGITALAIDPLTPSTLYATGGENGGGVYKSTDAGATWNLSNTGLPFQPNVLTPNPFALAVDPKTPTTLYLALYQQCDAFSGCTDGGIFKSIDGAASWHALQPFLRLKHTVTVVIDPITPSTLYAGTSLVNDAFKSTGVFKSTDGGGTWHDTALPNFVTDVYALAIDPARLGTLYAGTAQGVLSIQQVGPCIGDCSGTLTVAVNDIITLVNIALGSAQASACPQGVPSGAAVDIGLVIQAVNNALTGCE